MPGVDKLVCPAGVDMAGVECTVGGAWAAAELVPAASVRDEERLLSNVFLLSVLFPYIGVDA